MTIKGIGKVSKEDILKIFAKDVKEDLKDGTISMDDLASMYKLEMVRKASKIGKYEETFNANYRRVPDCIKDDLSPEQIAAVVDAIYQAYSDGKNEDR